MRTICVTFSLIHAALKERSENGWMNLCPILLSSFTQEIEFLFRQLDRIDVVEE